jgi:hypothetical protein
MIRWMATLTAPAVLSVALAWLPPAARAAPQSAPQSAPQTAPLSAPWPAAQQSEQPPAPDAADAVSPLTPPNRKPRSGVSRPATGVNLIRGGDTATLVAQLPWWRTAASGPDPGELESPILTACDVWLGFPFATGDAQSLTVRLSAAQHANEIELVSNKIRVADPGEINEIDLTAPAQEPPGGDRPWLRGLLALLGVALAGFSAVRYLVA